MNKGKASSGATKKDPSKSSTKPHESTKSKTTNKATGSTKEVKTSHKPTQSEHKLPSKKKEEKESVKETQKESVKESVKETQKESVKEPSSHHQSLQSQVKKEEKKSEPSTKTNSKHISKNSSVEISKENSKKDLTESQEKPVEKPARVHHEKKGSEVGARSSSQIKERGSDAMKKFNNEEKKELMKQITALKKENLDLKKKVDEFDKLNNDLMEEVEENQKNAEQFLKEKNEMEATTKKATGELEAVKKQCDDLQKQLTTMQEDMEILNEELSTKELELEVAAKKFNDFKLQVEQDKTQSKVPQPQSETPKVETETPSSNQPPSEEQQAKILELEDVVAELSSQLKSASEQRDYAISYYKEQMAKLNEQLTEAQKKTEVIEEKDDLIRQLTDKLKDEEGIIDSLKSQINALSPANDMYEQIIIEKDELEQQLEEIKAENEKLKEDLQNDEEMVNDLDSALKISEQMMKQSQDEALKAKNSEKELLARIEECDKNEKSLLAKMNELKQINQILKDEVSKFKDSTLDIDDVLNKNLTTTSKIQTLQRQKVLISLENIEIDKYILRNKIINSMIPRKMLQKGCIDVFEKFINIQCLRKKTYELIFNIIDNDILTDDKEGGNKMEAVEGETNKKLIAFYRSVLYALIDYNSVLFKIEIMLSKCDSEKLKEFCSSENFIALYSNICAGSTMIDVLINMIKTDSFSVQYQTHADGLKTLNVNMQNQIGTIEIGDDYLYDYVSNIIAYFVKIAVMFKMDSIDLLVRGDKEGKLGVVGKNMLNGYRNVKKILSKINEKFFTSIKYDTSNSIFDVTSSYYTQLVESLKTLDDSSNTTDNNYSDKFDALVEVSNKVCVVASSSLEKYEKEKENEDKSEASDGNKLPLDEWSKITTSLYEELESIAKMKDELDESSQIIKQAKMEKALVEAQLEDLKRSKQANDNKLGELVVKVGRISQLESTNEEYAKRIEKYKVAVDGLQKNLEDTMAKSKEYKQKYEHLLSKKDTGEARKSARLGVGITSNSIGALSGMSGNYAPIINTVCLLQKERKFLKSKLMKEKLVSLIEDNDSYMNKFIQKDLKISKHDNEKDFYRNIEDNVKNLNSNYDKIRQKLCLPKVFDLSSDSYNFKEEQGKEESSLNKMRIDYMKDADKILYNMFGDNTLDKTFKEVIDNDISRTLQYYADKKLMVGRIKFMENDEKKKNDVNVSQSNKVPIILSEESIKLLNKTFIH